MRVLLVPVGSSGDVHPFIGIGVELKKRGHEIVMITNGHFRTVVERAGFQFVELGTQAEFNAVADNPNLWDPNRGFFLLAQQIKLFLRPMFKLIESHYVPGQTVMAAGSLAFGARIAEEKLGIRNAMVHLQPAIIRSIYDPPILPNMGFVRKLPPFAVKIAYWLADKVIDGVLANAINEFRAELELPSVRGIMNGYWISPRLTLGLFPGWYCAPQKDWPASLKLTGFPLYDGEGVETTSRGLDAFLGEGPPPVVFTAGSAMKMSRNFFQESAEACRMLKCRGILLSQYEDQIPTNLLENVRHFSYLPFSRVFPRSAVVVHHGGIGTTAQALAAGVPQLIVPFSHDQPDNAARVERLGVGISLKPSSYRSNNVARLLTMLMENSHYKECARKVAEKIDKRSAIDKTCDLIEGLKL